MEEHWITPKIVAACLGISEYSQELIHVKSPPLLREIAPRHPREIAPLSFVKSPPP